MRWVLALFCAVGCAVSAPKRDELLSDATSEPAMGAAIAPTPVVEAAPEIAATCEEAPYRFCATTRYRVDGVYFDTGKDSIKMPESGAVLAEIAKALIAQPSLRVDIEVHTDAQGADSYNLVLSQKRAEAIVKYLVGYGVPASQVSAKGYGETKPIAPNDTNENRAKNRRIEIIKQ